MEAKEITSPPAAQMIPRIGERRGASGAKTPRKNVQWAKSTKDEGSIGVGSSHFLDDEGIDVSYHCRTKTMLMSVADPCIPRSIHGENVIWLIDMCLCSDFSISAKRTITVKNLSYTLRGTGAPQVPGESQCSRRIDRAC